MKSPGAKPHPPKQLSLVNDGETTWRGRKVSVKERQRNAERAKEWREKNKDRFESKRNEWAKANHDRIVERRREHYQLNKDRILSRNKKAYLKRKAEGRNKSHAARVKAKYGLEWSDYCRIADAQGGCCAICRDASQKLVVDHCHVTGVVRGLLCDRCNVGIGRLGDNATGVQKALDYLKAFEERHRAAS